MWHLSGSSLPRSFIPHNTSLCPLIQSLLQKHILLWRVTAKQRSSYFLEICSIFQNTEKGEWLKIDYGIQKNNFNFSLRRADSETVGNQIRNSATGKQQIRIDQTTKTNDSGIIIEKSRMLKVAGHTIGFSVYIKVPERGVRLIFTLKSLRRTVTKRVLRIFVPLIRRKNLSACLYPPVAALLGTSCRTGHFLFELRF